MTASRKAACGPLPPLSLIATLQSPCPLLLLLFSVFPQKNLLPLLGQKKMQSVACIWGVAFIRSKKIGEKALPLFGVLPLLIQKKIFEVYALIRSVASIRAKLGA